MNPSERKAAQDQLIEARCQLLATDFVRRARVLGIDIRYICSTVTVLTNMYSNRALSFEAAPFHGGMEVLQDKLESLANRPLQLPPLRWEHNAQGEADPSLGFGMRALVKISPWEHKASPLQGDWYLSADGIVTEGPFPND